MDFLKNLLFKISPETVVPKSQSLDVGDQLKLSRNETILFGRAEFPVKGFTTYSVKDLGLDEYVSSYGVQIGFGRDGELIVQKPDLKTRGGEQYVSSNTIEIRDTRDIWEEIERVYNSGPGRNLNAVRVTAGNGSQFVIKIVDDSTLELQSVTKK